MNPETTTYSLDKGAQDRTYYHVCCRRSAGEQVFEHFHDEVTLTWIRDVAHDKYGWYGAACSNPANMIADLRIGTAARSRSRAHPVHAPINVCTGVVIKQQNDLFTTPV